MERRVEARISDMDIAAMEAKLKPTAERLRDAISTKLDRETEMSAGSRLSIAEVLKQTVPDPVEIGLTG
jgi:type IV secretion system protein VirD4